MITIDYLKNNNLILLEVISGSKAYGLATENSDTDIRGVFFLPKDVFYSTEYIPQIANETNDIVYYELGRFIELLLKNNPNILEILATPEDCILYKNPIMNDFNLDDFLSKLCIDSFAGYAMTQIHKAKGLNKKIMNPMEKERKSILDFCTVFEDAKSIPLKRWLEQNKLDHHKCGLIKLDATKGLYGLYYDDKDIFNYTGICRNTLANEVSLSSIPKGEKLLTYLYFNQDGYSTYCKNYKEYWNWVENRNEDRYATNLQHGKNYDSKNLMHTIRLLELAKQIVKNKALNIRIENREELLTIKNGNLSYEEIIAKAENLLKEIDALSKEEILPNKPNSDFVMKKLVEIRSHLYK